MIKKLLVTIGLIGASFACDAGIISSNFATAGTNVIVIGRQGVYQIDVISPTAANTVNFYDTSSNQLTYTTPAYTMQTNIPGLLFTNLQTNAIFVYATSTQYLIQTNVTLAGAYHTNFTIGARSNNVPLALSVVAAAAGYVSTGPVDLNFVQGITLTTQTNSTVLIYTRN